MTVSMSQSYQLYALQLASNNGEPGSKIASHSHMTSCLTAVEEIDILSPMWSCDVSLNNCLI